MAGTYLNRAAWRANMVLTNPDPSERGSGTFLDKEADMQKLKFLGILVAVILLALAIGSDQSARAQAEPV